MFENICIDRQTDRKFASFMLLLVLDFSYSYVLCSDV